MAQAFQTHLQALNTEFERVISENLELKKGLYDPMKHHLLRPSTSNTPLCPSQRDILRVSATSTNSPDLPGSVEEKAEKKARAPKQIWQSEAIEPEGPSGRPPQLGTRVHDLNSSGEDRHASKVSDLEETEEAEENVNFLLLLDIVPALVILASTLIAGISADYSPEDPAWMVLEAVFTTFFLGEIIVKLRYFGFREFLFKNDWYWSWFDILCVVLAITDNFITYFSFARGDGNSDIGYLTTLKMLKLARLGRIIRLLKFKIFQELKLMIQGVFTGLRVLFWAVVLFIGCMYLIGVVSRTLFGDSRVEFNSVPTAMFTAFRCFTDGCTSVEGEPLQEKLRNEFGGLFLVAYILLFLFITIGIFNLIMAVFIDNVTDGSTKKRQRELGANAPKTAWILSSVLRQLILTNMFKREVENEALMEGTASDEQEKSARRRNSKLLQEKLLSLQEMYGYKPHTAVEYDELTSQIRQEMSTRNVQVSRGEFNQWLSTDRKLLETLNDAEIDLSCKSDLFDVLDADLSGVLEFEEMIDGLLKCRGPASKTDIIAIRLKTSLLVSMVTKLCNKMGLS